MNRERVIEGIMLLMIGMMGILMVIGLLAGVVEVYW